ncbi:hypothetical protein BDZ89DRAFT_1017497 [Hymenopellis radicata]|nr:hypothetical protein BDZ89DRAFT_1017497 [Hymenopellis radicata]
MPPSTQRPTCPYFQKGTCQYGPTCRLSHQQSPAQTNFPSPSNNPFPKRACTFYAEGRCTKGDQCTFLHPQSQTQASSSWRREPTKKVLDTPTGKPGCAFFQKGKCAKGQDCPFPHPDGQNPLCAFYLNGTCRFGSKCSSSHSSGAVDIPARAVREYRPIAIRSENGDKASFGPGAQIAEITTSFESRTLIISNIPDEADQGTLISVFEPFGHLEKIALLRDTDTATARVTYASALEASAAIRGLRSSRYEPKMDLKVVESGQAVLRSTKVKVSWFAPRRIGWAHYPTIAAAKSHAKRLSGATFNGYLLDATFQTPSIHQTRSFSVEIKGLPAHTSEEHLKRFCKSDSVQLKQLGYDRKSSLLDVEAQLTAIGPLDRFDAMPEDKKRPKILAFAQFAQPDDAARAVAALHQTTQSFLNRSPMWLEHIHAVKYTVPQPLFDAVKGALDAVKEGEKECKLRVYGPETTDVTPEVCIRLFSPNAKALGVMKRRLETILDGHRVLDEVKRVVWDDFFATAEGLTYLRRLGGPHGVYVKCDSRNRSIHLYGADDNVAALMKSLVEKAESLKAEKRTIKLDKPMLRQLMKGGLEKLMADFGDPTMAIDIVQRTLNVGEAVDVDEVRGALTRLAGANIQNGLGDAQACPVCYCDVTNPVVLQCGHAYCKECLAHMLTTTSPSSPIVKCIHEGSELCSTGIDLAVIRDLLRPEQEQHLFQTAFLAYIHARGDEFKYCPTPDCGVVYRSAHEGTVLTCPSCVNRICAACHVQFHEGLTCAQHRGNAEGGNQQFQEWKAVNGVKECPNCRANIQKSEGCNHMTCSRCQTHMCWVCLKTFEAKGMDSKGGIYDHMRKAHGGMYGR